MKTLFYNGIKENIILNELYLFGQLWDGYGDGNTLLNVGASKIHNHIIAFKVIEYCENIKDSLVRVCQVI